MNKVIFHNRSGSINLFYSLQMMESLENIFEKKIYPNLYSDRKAGDFFKTTELQPNDSIYQYLNL